MCVTCVLTADGDGAWGAWSPWAGCSGTCTGNNRYYRERDCDNPPPSGDGEDCPSTDRDREEVEIGKLNPSQQ
mgnify:FL=1